MLDLKDDPALIAEYRRHHEQIWPEVADSMRASGIVAAEIYLRGTREGGGGRCRPRGAEVGATDVALSAGAARCRAR
jgi:hypothetical protein